MSTTGPLAAHAAPYLKLALPAKFYHVPADAPAVFSTRNGTRSKRQLHSPPPAPIVRSDFDGEVKRMAALLRKELPQIAGLIRNPGAWKDLYFFFDAVDLWVEGAVFLYYVVSHISKDNEIAHESYTRMHQNAMIFQYASNWVTNNADRIALLPSETDFTTLFNQFQKGEMCGFRDYEFETMKQALRFHHARLREKYNAVAQAHRVDTVQQPTSHPAHGIQQGLVPTMQHAQPMDSQPAPVVDYKGQYHHKIVPVHPVAHPTPQTYSHFMETQRTITGAVTSPPTARGPFYKGTSDLPRGPRAHGYSGDAGRSGNPPQKGQLLHGNENHVDVHDQRAVDNSSHRSLSSQVPHMNQPIYVHNSQCASPPHGREAVVNPRSFSESQANRTGCSNNSRLWNDSSKFPRPSQGSYESFDKPSSGPQSTGHHRSRSIPFEGHPNAKITDKASTFYYNKENMDQKPDHYNNRTLYVYGATVEMFSSHALKDMMSEVGTVDSITYLYTNSNMGPAFIAFTEEGAVQSAISQFNGITSPSGRRMEVKIPDKGRTSRDRSGSQSSQAYCLGQNSNYPARHNHRNLRKCSISSRPYNRSHRTSDADKSQDHSPDTNRCHSENQSPLTSGFQAQLSVSPPFTVPVPVETLHSSISEIIQHQSAMERLRLAQMPLETIDNYSGGNRKPNGPLHEKSRWNKKENSPVKDASNSATPVVTPVKEQLLTSDTAPGKSNVIIDLVEVLRASVRQKSPTLPLNSSDSKDESKFCENDSVTEPKQTGFSNVNTTELTTQPGLDHNITIVEMPVGVDASTVTTGDRKHSPQSNDAPKSRKPKKNKHKQGNIRREASDSSEATATNSTASVDTSSPTLTDTTDYKSATASFSEASSRNHSFASAKSTVSLPTADDSSMEQDLQSTPTPVNKHSKAGSSSSSSSFSTPKPPSSRHQYRSRDFKNKMKPSEFYNNTYRTANTKSGIADNNNSDDEMSKLVPQNISCTDGANDIENPTTSLRDPNQWPALERTNTASSRIADGKPPVIASIPPLTGHNTSAGMKNSIAIVPALPLNMIPRRRNSGVSQAWPRVRKCVGK